jgi:radical SAM superfamily enzyme YgiQ (UPF0313 family)
LGGKCFPLVTYAVQSKGPVLSGLMLDNGPALLAAYLNQAGYRPVIFDYNSVKTIEKISKNGREGFLKETIDELDDYIKSKNAKAVGFKLYTNGFADSVKIAKELKVRNPGNPGLVTIAGGPQVDWYGEGILDYTDAFDILSYGYADAGIVRIADYIHKGQGNINKIPNLIYRGGDKPKRTGRLEADINELILPLYDEEIYTDVKEKIMIPVIEDSRGCPYSKCSFCIHPRIGGKFKERDVEKLVGEIEHHMEKYGFRVLRLSGPSPPSEYMNMLAYNLPEGCRVSAFGSSDSVYDYKKIRDKVLAVFVGVESADKGVLEELLRKTDRAENYLLRAKEMIAGLKKNSIATITSMIVPCPDDNHESMNSTLEFLYETDPDFASVLPLFPMPGTPLTRNVLTGKIKGMEIESGYKERLMMMDVDLLQPPSTWPEVPYRTRVNGEWLENPFVISQQFSNKLMDRGIHTLSDEIVLMSYLYHNGLSENQDERRKQCLEFMGLARKYIAEGDAKGIGNMVNRINENQLGGVV